jgi:pSer/pThr/pTyr-binding forkhead associated (FHA) protein
MSSLPPAIPALTARILCRLRPGVTERFLLQPAEALVGREPGLAVTVPVDGVSRRHARITFDGKSYRIENLSPAGTFLNGALVVSERLAHLDVITLGKNVDLLFLLRPEEQGGATTEGIVRAALVPDEPDAAPYEIAPGEILIGRSSANNLVVESSGAVSKVHARIERTPQQLVLRDLGSSNGTFVNGERVMTALLRDGDEIGLANVIRYRVVVERGLVVAAPFSGAPPAESAAVLDDRGEFSAEWKTRYDWDSSEIRGIAALQARLIAEDGERKRAKAKKEAPTEQFGAVTPGPSAGGAKPAPAPAKPAPTPAAKVVPAVVPPTPSATPPPPAAAPPTPPPPVVTPAPPEVEAPVIGVRLRGPAGDLVVTQPGEYILGRAKDAPLRVNDPAVSRRHALVVLTGDGKAFIEHSGGANGTRLNGASVVARTRISDGDRVGLGEVELLVSLTTASAPR